MGENKSTRESRRKTPAEIARLIWDIFEANPHFGRHRIAMTLWALRLFVAASTVRNVLLRPAPPKAPAAAAVKVATTKPRQIVARYPNHVWSVDRTRVWRWRIWPTWVLVGIDHYSRLVTTTCPLEGPNAACPEPVEGVGSRLRWNRHLPAAARPGTSSPTRSQCSQVAHSLN
ncbi:MAG TPA: hypothetical protein VNA25_07015 [Phycisphaerae bacterium]|nr:hypothetical protein [Phycisphaerae bacterium]